MDAEGDIDDEIDPLSDPEERRVLYAALDSFRQYRRAAHYNITHLRRQSFHALPVKHSSLLQDPPFSILSNLQAVDDAIDKNADISEAILAVGLETYGIDPASTEWKGAATPNDMDKARSTIRQLYRDFSAEGSTERSATFSPIVQALEIGTGDLGPAQRHTVKVLVPGAGLGRLMLEVCASGYTVEGNEISYHQLLASNWILNNQTAPAQHELYPWALSFSNHRSRQNQLRKCMIPDIVAGAMLTEATESITSPVHAYERLSMTSGDFCVLYKKPYYREAFDAVMTCFFIDTAPNVLSYVETVLHCLRPGGLWINIGPLLWHFEGRSKPESTPERVKSTSPDEDMGIGEPGSVELTDGEVIALLQKSGFVVIEHDIGAIETGYIQDPLSMLHNVYEPSFWVARKKEA